MVQDLSAIHAPRRRADDAGSHLKRTRGATPWCFMLLDFSERVGSASSGCDRPRQTPLRGSIVAQEHVAQPTRSVAAARLF
jgi:hypothetical protein